MSDSFILFGAPRIEPAAIESVVEVLESGWLGTGPKVAQFEKEFAEYKGARYAVAVNSCTAALHLSLIAAGIGPGDEVITTPMTFCATINAIIHVGATPVLVDINPLTWNIDANRIEEKISDKTKAILPVHFAGRLCDMEKISQIAQAYELKVIEDCAHAIESNKAGRSSGTFGDFGCFSFYVTKNLVTGEGGMILVKDEERAERLKSLRLHGLSRDAWKRFSDSGYAHYQVIEAGYKYNMMDLQAAIGIQQLENVDRYWQRREEIWSHYVEEFSSLPIILPVRPESEARHAYHLFTVLIDEEKTGMGRDQFLVTMANNRIGTGVHYMSLPEHSYYQKRFAWNPEDYPNAMKYGRQTASLPLSARLLPDDVERIVGTVKQVLG